MNLSERESARYARHLLLPEVGRAGQQALRNARVAVVGAGGLGTPAATYLAAAGVGTLTLVDGDAVERSNLQRQILYSDADTGRGKCEVAAERLRAQNPDIEVQARPVRLTAENAAELLGDHDLVVDGTDNFATRYLINDACVLAGRPFVYGSIFRFSGQVSVFDPGAGPCYRCLFPEPPPPEAAPNCAEAGVLGVLPGVLGSLQATEALKFLLGLGRSLVGRLLLYDAKETGFREIAVARDPGCPACGDEPSVTRIEDIGATCAVSSSAEPNEDPVPCLSPAELRRLYESGEPFRLVDVRTQKEVETEAIDGSRHVPREDLPDAARHWRRDEAIVVYCLSGSRSEKAVRTLLEMGFSRVRHLEGGLSSWLATGRGSFG